VEKMNIRDEVIEKINRFLREDISEQFIMNELDAVMDGRDYFYVHNKHGDGIKIRIIYYRVADVIDYRILHFKIKLHVK